MHQAQQVDEKLAECHSEPFAKLRTSSTKNLVVSDINRLGDSSSPAARQNDDLGDFFSGLLETIEIMSRRVTVFQADRACLLLAGNCCMVTALTKEFNRDGK